MEALLVQGVERGATVVSEQEDVRGDPAVCSLQCLSPCQDLIFNPELLGATVILQCMFGGSHRDLIASPLAPPVEALRRGHGEHKGTTTYFFLCTDALLFLNSKL